MAKQKSARSTNGATVGYEQELWQMADALKHDPSLILPYQDNLSALIHEPSFKQAAGEAVFSKARVINTLGNRAFGGEL